MKPAHRKLIGRLLLFGGLAFALTRMLPEVPRTQPLVFDLSGPDRLDSVAVQLTRQGQEEPSRGFSLPVKGSRRKMRHSVDLPHGQYTLQARLTDKKGRETQVSRRVTLDGNEVRVKIALSP